MICKCKPSLNKLALPHPILTGKGQLYQLIESKSHTQRSNCLGQDNTAFHVLPLYGLSYRTPTAVKDAGTDTAFITSGEMNIDCDT